MPGILEWPARIKKPFSTDLPAVTSDYFPTALAAAGIPLPDDRDYDGINLLPLIDGKMKERKGIGFHCRGMQAWVERRYKVIRITSKKREANPWELYDLLADPFEEKDLAKELPQVVRRMDEEFTVWAKSAKADEQKVLDKYHSAKTKGAEEKE
jgi:arylsulfatase A-like enzyme